MNSLLIEKDQYIEYNDYINEFYLKEDNIKKYDALITDAIINKKPFAIAKCGDSESTGIINFLNGNKNMPYSLYANAGVFPNDTKTYISWFKIFSESIINLNYLGYITESYYHFKTGRSYFPNSAILYRPICTVRSIEPFYLTNPWSKKLDNKKILVISPFTESINKQYHNLDKIWEKNKIISKNFLLFTIKAPLSSILTNSNYSNWIEAFNDMKRQMDGIEFDILLVGAGAYSIPLVSYAKKIGKIGIHLGGSLQIFFGIKGKRWDNHPIIKQFYNEHWIRPNHLETPENTKLIENSCYW